jgi:hypothetical protein
MRFTYLFGPVIRESLYAPKWIETALAIESPSINATFLNSSFVEPFAPVAFFPFNLFGTTAAATAGHTCRFDCSFVHLCLYCSFVAVTIAIAFVELCVRPVLVPFRMAHKVFIANLPSVVVGLAAHAYPR